LPRVVVLPWEQSTDDIGKQRRIHVCGQRGGGRRSQLLRHYSVRLSPRIGFDRFNQFLPEPGFRDLDFPLKSASCFSVCFVAAGDLFLVAYPPTTRPLESSADQNATRLGFRDLGGPPQYTSVVSTTKNGARHRGVTRRAHVFSEASRLLVGSSPAVCASQLQADTVTVAWSRSLSLSLRRHLGGGRQRFTPWVLQACVADVVSGATSVSM
jgi:hypothetical protein